MARILIIEPDRLLANTYRQYLQDASHEVVVCGSAQAGVMAADQFQPQVIILELQLVEHSGIEFLYELRSYQDWQNIPVIIHSQVPPSEFNDNYQMLKDELGVEAYLYKIQTSLSQLLSAVESQLEATPA